MNKNALTEQRRETVIGLLKNMNIKKAPLVDLIKTMYTNACRSCVTCTKIT